MADQQDENLPSNVRMIAQGQADLGVKQVAARRDPESIPRANVQPMEDIEMQEQQQQVPPQTGQSPLEKVLTLLVAIIAQGTQLDTNFTRQNVVQTAKSAKLLRSLPGLLKLLHDVGGSEADLYRAILNEGNFMEITAEAERQGVEPLVAEMGYSIKRLSRNAGFIHQRIQLMNGLMSGQQNPQLLAQSKALCGAPFITGNAVNQIEWDTVSFKIPPQAIEYFALQNRQFVPAMSAPLVGMMCNIQYEISNRLVELVQEAVTRLQMPPEIARDQITIFLERSIGAPQMFDINQYSEKYDKLSDEQLIGYIDFMQPMFRQGLIPGAVTPSKIAACQDVTAMAALRASIQMLAQNQIQQGYETISNVGVRMGMRELLQTQGGQYNAIKQMSLNMAQQMDKNERIAKGIIGEMAFQDRKDIVTQAAGGANSLDQDIQLAQQQSVVNLTFYQKELLRQNLSVLVACLRIRFDALQQSSSGIEMAPESDIQHLIFVRKVAKYCDPGALQWFTSLSQMLMEAYANGFNVMKGVYDKGLPQDEINRIQSELEQMADSVLQANSLIYGNKESFIKSLYASMADMNRRASEWRSRQLRRNALMNSISDPIIGSVL